MLVYIDTNVGVLKGEVIEEANDRYKVKINDETIFVKKEICKVCDEDFENTVPDLLENIEDYGDAITFDILDRHSQNIKHDEESDKTDYDKSVDEFVEFVKNYEYNPELEYDESKENEKENGVEVKMNLKEKILSKLNYKKIAEEVYDLLENDIEKAVLGKIDESDIAYEFVKQYSDSFIEQAESIVLEDVFNEIEYSAIEEHFLDVLENNLN